MGAIKRPAMVVWTFASACRKIRRLMALSRARLRGFRRKANVRLARLRARCAGRSAAASHCRVGQAPGCLHHRQFVKDRPRIPLLQIGEKLCGQRPGTRLTSSHWISMIGRVWHHGFDAMRDWLCGFALLSAARLKAGSLSAHGPFRGGLRSRVSH